MEDSEHQHLPLMAVILIYIPFAFVLMVFVFVRATFDNPRPGSGNCQLNDVGERIVSRVINGTLELTSGIFVVKDEQNRLTALARCGKQFCSGPYHELEEKRLKEPITVSYCGQVLLWIEFGSGSTIYPPSTPERR